jgi:pSer/pThr/pTyr-binding forkhead associated (FHA) protein
VVQRRAFEAEGAAGSGTHPRARSTFALREGSVEHKLRGGQVVVGRGSGVDIVLTGPLVSRRHAELRETDDGLLVTDLGSRNGVFINGRQLSEPTLLFHGDSLNIGDNTFLVVEVLDPGLRSETLSEMRAVRESSRVPAGAYTNDEVSVATRRADVLQMLGSVVDKALALGRGQEAEHIIGTHLVAALSDATAGRGVAPEVARSAAQYAVKLACATGKAAWLDFAFRLYNALGETIPLPIVDEMYTVLRRVRGLDRELLRSYSEFLRARSAQLSAPERFVLQRLEGLERLAGWHSGAAPWAVLAATSQRRRAMRTKLG